MEGNKTWGGSHDVHSVIGSQTATVYVFWLFTSTASRANPTLSMSLASRLQNIHTPNKCMYFFCWVTKEIIWLGAENAYLHMFETWPHCAIILPHIVLPHVTASRFSELRGNLCSFVSSLVFIVWILAYRRTLHCFSGFSACGHANRQVVRTLNTRASHIIEFHVYGLLGM